MSKKHKNDDFCGMSADEQKRQMMAFEEAFANGTVGELLDDIENTTDDERAADSMLSDMLGKIVDGDDYEPFNFDDVDDADALSLDFDEDEESSIEEPIPYSEHVNATPISDLKCEPVQSRPLPRFFTIEFVYGTTLIKVSDGLKTCTIDYNGLEKCRWDADRVARHLSRSSVDELQMFISEIQLLMPNFYPSYIGTTDTINSFMSSIKSFNDDRFVFFTRNFMTTDVPYSSLIVGYDMPEWAMESLVEVGEFLIENNLHTSFIETLYGIVTTGGFSTNSLCEKDLIELWSNEIFVDSNEAFVEQFLEDGDTERCAPDSTERPTVLVPYDAPMDPESNYTCIRYVDEAYSPIFAVLFDSEADFSEVDAMLNEMSGDDTDDSYNTDEPETSSPEFLDDDDSDDEDDEDYVAENEIIPGGDISEDDDEDDPEDMFDDTEDEEEPEEMEVKKIPGPQPDNMVVSKESGVGFNAKQTISDMTDDEIEEKYGDEYSDYIERGNRPAPRQSMKKSQKFDDGDMVVRRR